MDQQPINLFGGTIATLERSLDLRARQHEMILSNVANADTPNYTPFSMNVERALQEGVSDPTSSMLVRTDENHLSGDSIAGDSEIDTTFAEENALLFRGDQNRVDIDAEMTQLAKNGLLYKTSAQIAGGKFKSMKNAITGGTN